MNDNKAAPKIKTPDEIKSAISHVQSHYDPEAVLRKVETQLNSIKEGERKTTSDDPLFKALTLSEFKNGFLLATVVPEQYRTFGINMLRQLQVDYNCTLISEMAIAEHTTISYIRTLELQRIMDASLARPDKHKVNLTYISILSKELDRASRQFLNAIQTLGMFKQPRMQVNIKTDTAVIGQNQIVQSNNK